MKVAKCANASCRDPASSDISPLPLLVAPPTPVDVAGDVGQYASIAIGANGNPVISYYDFGGNRLKLAVCGDPSRRATSVWIQLTSSATP